MKLSNGNILITTGVAHVILAVSPLAFGKQFSAFMELYFYKISEGLFEFPLLNGTMDHENFAAFWFFYFGLLIIPLGFLVQFIESNKIELPKTFKRSYLVVTIIGVYMIPFSGMTFIMLPHAVYMLLKNKSKSDTL